MASFMPGDVVAYHNPHDSCPIQQNNQRALKDRVGIVYRIKNTSHYPIDVKWTSYCSLSHKPEHLVLIR